MQLKFRAAALAAVALCCTTAAHAEVLFQQNANGSGVWASQNDTTGGNGNFATSYDNFSLAGTSTITGVNFTGGFFNPATVANPTGFTVSFYADNAGQPGSSLLASFTPGNASQSCVGAVCSYSLSTNFAATGGTQYWMSIVPDLGFPPQWGWAPSSDGDNLGYQDFFGARSVRQNDFAFTLIGTAAVPEPSAWALLILGFSMTGAAMRSARRRTSTATRFA